MRAAVAVETIFELSALVSAALLAPLRSSGMDGNEKHTSHGSNRVIALRDVSCTAEVSTMLINRGVVQMDCFYAQVESKRLACACLTV